MLTKLYGLKTVLAILAGEGSVAVLGDEEEGAGESEDRFPDVVVEDEDIFRPLRISVF